MSALIPGTVSGRRDTQKKKEKRNNSGPKVCDSRWTGKILT